MMFVDGDWDVDLNDDPFFSNYDDSIHYSDDYTFDFDPLYPVYLSFDFNYDPTTCNVFQDIDTAVLGMRSYEVKGGTEKLCQYILEQQDLLKVPRHMWIVTGDSSGMSNTSTGGDKNDYKIIQDAFNLEYRQLIGVHNRNKAHVYSRKLCDYFLHHVPFAMDGRMKPLRDDIVKAKPDGQGKLFKDRSKGYNMDHLDNFRYFVNAMFPKGIQDIEIYSNNAKRMRG
jgi:phage terminase large subunit